VVDGLRARLGACCLPPGPIAGAHAGLPRSWLEVLFGDLGFGLGLPVPIHRASTAGPPPPCRSSGGCPSTGSIPPAPQSNGVGAWYAWASVIASDCHYIRRHRLRLTARSLHQHHHGSRCQLFRPPASPGGDDHAAAGRRRLARVLKQPWLRAAGPPLTDASSTPPSINSA
jgi:hypothetical protein